MARASAWLAIVFACPIGLFFSVLFLSGGIFHRDGPKVLLLILEMLVLLGGAYVVLSRKKPGLRLLAASWALTLGTSSAGLLRAAPKDGFVLTQHPATWAYVVVSITGLLLALLAHRPIHKTARPSQS